MKAQYENDTERGQGYGLFCVAEANFDGAAPCLYSLQRASDRKFLAQTGWQDAVDYLSPDSRSMRGNDLCLHVSREVVDNLDAQENYRLTVRAEGQGEQKGSLRVADVAYWRPDLDEGLRKAREEEARRAADEKRNNVVMDPSPAAEALLPDLDQPPKKNSPLWLVALCALLLAAAVAGGAWWWMRQAPPPPVAEAPAPTAPVKPEPATAPEPQAKPVPPQTTPAEPEPVKPPLPAVKPARQQVVEFFRGSPTPQGAMDLAATLPSGSLEEQDALFELWRYAVDNNRTEPLLPLGRCYDPSQPQWGSIGKNPARAWSYYERARATQAEAGAAQLAMKSWLTQETQKGSDQASAWLRQLP